MSADPDTGEIGKLRAGWPDPDGLTDDERWKRLAPEVRAELEKMMRGVHEQGARASKGTYYRGGHALVFLLASVAAAEDGAIGRTEAPVRAFLGDIAAGDELAAAALTPAGGLVRDRLARAALPLVGELWAELERRTGEALEARGVPWAPVVARILAGERGQRESDREREQEAGWPVAEVEIEPPPGLSYEQAAANDREDRAALAALGELRVPDPERPDAPELLAWDAWLAEWLTTKGAGAKGAAVLVAARRRAAAVAEEQAPPGDLWSLWSPPWGPQGRYGPLPVLAVLAEVAWPRLRAELERERRPVALPVGVLNAVRPLLQAGIILAGTDGREHLARERADGGPELLSVWKPPTVAVQEADRLLALARDGVGQLATVNGPRLVYWMAREAARHAPGASLEIHGGDAGNAYAELARMVGAPFDKAGWHAMRALLAGLGATWLTMETSDGLREGHILSVDYLAGGRGQGNVSRLKLKPGWPFQLDPTELRGERAALSALVPLPPLPGNLPPMPGGGGRPNDRAPAARLWLAVLAELAHQNREIYRGDGARLAGADLARLWAEMGMRRPEPLIVGAGLLEGWTRESDEGPALLERVGPDRYHLGAAFPEERRLLEEGGQRREGQAERAKIGAKKRAAKATAAAELRKRRGGGGG